MKFYVLERDFDIPKNGFKFYTIQTNNEEEAYNHAEENASLNNGQAWVMNINQLNELKTLLKYHTDPK